MATIITGSIVSEIRGSVGSESYSRNAHGPYVKARVTPINPNTVAQQAARANMRAAVLAWQVLSDSDRNAYIVEARSRSTQNRIGLPTRLTGYNIFIRQFMSYTELGLPVVVGIESPQLDNIPGADNIVLSTTAFTFDFDFGKVDPDIRILAYATPFRPASRVSFNPSTQRNLLGTAPAAIPVTVDLRASYEAIFGTLVGHAGEVISLGISTIRPLSAEFSTTQYLTRTIAA